MNAQVQQRVGHMKLRSIEPGSDAHVKLLYKCQDDLRSRAREFVMLGEIGAARSLMRSARTAGRWARIAKRRGVQFSLFASDPRD